MMQAKFTNCGRYSSRKIPNTVLIRRVGKYHETVTIGTPYHVTCTSQATPNRLPDSAQTGVGRMSAEDLEIGIKIVERECHQRQLAFFARRHRPVVFENISEPMSIKRKRSTNRVLA